MKDERAIRRRPCRSLTSESFDETVLREYLADQMAVAHELIEAAQTLLQHAELCRNICDQEFARLRTLRSARNNQSQA